MRFSLLPLFADDAVRLRFQWGRIVALSDWMTPAVAWLSISLVSAIILLLVLGLYLRDARELRPAWAAVLISLRAAALLGLLVIFLQPQWRTEREVVHNSRAVVLIDTSLSMGETDGQSRTGSEAGSRSRQVASALERTGFLQQLRATHDVVVFRFDESLSRIVSLAKVPAGVATGPSPGDAEPSPSGAKTEPSSRNSMPSEPVDWRKDIQPAGHETRLGQAIQQAIMDQQSAPVSGVVVITDGGQNAGTSPETAAALAREAKIPLYPIGVGSTRRPVQVRVYDLEAPQRAHPGDPYTVAGMIQAQGLAGQSVQVQLYLRDPAKRTEQLLDSQQVILGADGEVVPAKFQVTPTETGKRQLSLRIQTPPMVRHADDSHREADIELVERKTRVLLFAGGPMRDYQFLRTLLFRDKFDLRGRLPANRQAGHFPGGQQNPRPVP